MDIGQNAYIGGAERVRGFVKVNDKTETKPAKKPPGTKREAFIVQCTGYRCMAYRDRMGKWRDYFNDDEIQGEVKIISAA